MKADASHWRRQSGQGKYAKPERERRFLLVADPPPGVASRRIEDHYIEGTRLRLRHVAADAEDVYKLTQKVRVHEEDPADLLITNTYLAREEHAVLSTLPGRTVSKTRSVHRFGEHDFAVDVFHGRLRGLRLAEVEVESLHGSLPLPTWLGGEVTHDDRYSGGALAFAHDQQMRDLFAP
jgi:CYTH domain-containing protein